jgi:hypothetical protein
VINSPQENIIELIFSNVGFLSAIFPPRKYPILNPDKTTPIKLPQVYVVLPNIGVIILLEIISRDITITPDVKASMANFQALVFNEKILCNVMFGLMRRSFPIN